VAISIKLKKRWDVYPTLQDVLAATKNLSVSPFGLTEEGLQDFRGIKLIGERAQVPLRNGYMWENISKPSIPPYLMPILRARCGSILLLKKQRILPL